MDLPYHLDGLRWRIYKDRRNFQYMFWWAQPIVHGKPRDPRRFHSWNAAMEHVTKAMQR